MNERMDEKTGLEETHQDALFQRTITSSSYSHPAMCARFSFPVKTDTIFGVSKMGTCRSRAARQSNTGGEKHTSSGCSL
jgi:hypothetical protein